MNDLPAFPTMGRFIETDGTMLQEASTGGLTKREYIATAVMAAFISTGGFHVDIPGTSLEYADALLKKLNAAPSPGHSDV